MASDSSPGQSNCTTQPNIIGQNVMQYNLGEDVQMKPKLLDALKDVGAISKIYTRTEVLNFFQKYVFEKNIRGTNRTLICDEKLKNAFGVSQIDASKFIEIVEPQLIPVCKQDYSRASHSGASTSNQTYSSPLNLIVIPNIPEPISDAETEYSVQYYSTEECRDVSDTESSEEEENNFVEGGELEIVTSDEESFDNKYCDSDGGESVMLETFESGKTFLSCDEDNFADESDTSSLGSTSDCEIEHSTEDEKDSWLCVQCGVKNIPYMRLCSKCYQTRKDWLPERPKKRKKKRKPRPKKKNGRGNKQKLLAASSEIILNDSTTMACSSSQESGFGSQEFSASECSTTSVFPTRERAHERKRKLSFVGNEESSAAKIPRYSVLSINLRNKFGKFIRTRNGRCWLMNSGLPEYLKEYSSDSDNDLNHESDRPSRELCNVCFARPINASIVHGRISHIAFCYPCAKKLHSNKQRCPICRRKIHMITKNA